VSVLCHGTLNTAWRTPTVFKLQAFLSCQPN